MTGSPRTESDLGDDEEFQPVEAPRVMRRALLLAAVTCRGNIEFSPDAPVSKTLVRRIRHWVKRLELQKEMDASEAMVIKAPLGWLSERERNQATWRVEGLAILAWALGRINFLPVDRKVDPFAVTDSIFFLNDDAEQLIDRSSMKDAATLSDAREFFYAVHCRLRQFLRDPTAKTNFAGWIEPTWLDRLGVEPDRLIVAGDLGLQAKPLSQVEEGVVREIEHAVCERHRAIIWGTGEEPTYADFTVDT